MLHTVAAVLLVFWLVDCASGYPIGSLLRGALLILLIVAALQLLGERRGVWFR